MSLILKIVFVFAFCIFSKVCPGLTVERPILYCKRLPGADPTKCWLPALLDGQPAWIEQPPNNIYWHKNIGKTRTLGVYVNQYQIGFQYTIYMGANKEGHHVYKEEIYIPGKPRKAWEIVVDDNGRPINFEYK